jgi:hypothetical protein
LSIIAQNAGTTAANILGPLAPQDNVDAYLRRYDIVRQHVFNGTLVLAGAESIVETFEADEPETSNVTSISSHVTTTAPSGADLDTFVLNSGKYEGKTFAQVKSLNPGWFAWAVGNLKNPYVVNKAREYIAQNPELANAS